MRRDIVPQNATLEPCSSPCQARAILALAGGSTITAAAADAGVDRSTVYRWLNEDPAFVAELNRSKRDQVERIQGELRGLASDAVAALRELIRSADTPAAVRLKAALSALHAVGGIQADLGGITDPEEIRQGWAQREFLKKLGSFP